MRTTSCRSLRKYILGSKRRVVGVILASNFPREDLRAMKTDTEIERDVKAELGWDPQIDETDIAVGPGSADRMVCAGVMQVKNELTIRT